MEYKIVTPMMLWQDFNPTKDPLEVTMLGIKSTASYIAKDLTFTVESTFDGKIRAYASVVVQKNKVAPTVIFIPTGEAPINKTEFFEVLIKAGFNVITVDYGGETYKKQYFTTYPKSLSHCVFATNRKKVYEPTEAAKSPWFTWIKVIRRAITLAFEEPNVDKTKLILLGYIEGAQLAWQTAGIDGRVSAVIPVGACGYVEYFNQNKYEQVGTTQFSDERECWLAGISTQAYAKMVMCPVYYISGTNSTYADMDRVSDLFALVPSKKKYMSFSVGTNNSIASSNFVGAINWAKYFLSDDNPELYNPQLKTYVSDGKLYASVTDITGFKKVEIFYALDELNPSFRSWNRCKVVTTVENSEVLSQLVPREESKLLFAFATVTYENGVVLSTAELLVDLKNVNLDKYDTESRAESRFIFTNKMSAQAFSVENYNPVVDENIIKVRTGPNGLKGVAITEGKLCTYNVSPPASRHDDDYILQMEVYCPEPRDIEIVLFTAENGSTKYVYKVSLAGVSKKWQRVKLLRTDFKTEEHKQLRSWREVKKMKIKNAENVLFNNMLWI